MNVQLKKRNNYTHLSMEKSHDFSRQPMASLVCHRTTKIVRHNHKIEYRVHLISSLRGLFRPSFFILGLLIFLLNGWLKSSSAFYEPSEPSYPKETLNVLENSRWLHVANAPPLTKIFDLVKLSQQQIQRFLELEPSLSQLRPSQELYLKYHPEGEIEKLIVTLDSTRELYLLRKNLTFQKEIRSRQGIFVHGTLQTSLQTDAYRAGLSQKLLFDLVKIFRWEIDLLLYSQPRDQFSVIYEQHQWDEDQQEGEILAAEWFHQGHLYQAVRYTDAQGVSDYYTPTGEHLRKTFLLTPVDFVKISSDFGSRHHPILHKMSFHKGMDYAAPMGTPVTAAGAAKVIFIGYKGGYGKTIILEHSDRYTTLYAHLSKFAQGLRVGQQVLPEDIIGYVGQTGLATAPHLHYEFYVDGLQQNPYQANLPLSLPIAEKYQEDFFKETKPWVTQLETMSPLQRNNNSEHFNKVTYSFKKTYEKSSLLYHLSHSNYLKEPPHPQ